jgi:pyruvate formate lyase activating enzyme
MDSPEHKQFTGVPNEPILQNLEALSKKRKSMSIRIPIIPGVTDESQNIGKIGKFLSSLTCSVQIGLLPFHGAWAHKCKKLGKEIRVSKWQTPSEADIGKIREELASYGLTAGRESA